MKKHEIQSVINRKKFKWEKFHSDTKLPGLYPDLSRPIKKPQTYYKGYPRLHSVTVPYSCQEGANSVIQILKRRSSSREFQGKTLALEEVGTILKYSCGIREEGSQPSRRFYPSAGALYPIETYIISLKTALPKGLYHYYVKTDRLEELALFDRFDAGAYFTQSQIQKASMIIVMTACIKRSLQKYGERAYRYALLEAGHIGQNASLLCASLSIGACAIGGFYDDSLNQLLDLEEGDEEVVYCLALG